MFFGSERAGEFIILAGEALLIKPQRQLMVTSKRDVTLHHKHVLISIDLISVQLRQQKRLNVRRLRKEAGRIQKIRQLLTLPVIGKEEEGLVPFDWAT